MYLLETQQFSLRDTRDPHGDETEGVIVAEWNKKSGPMSAPFPYDGNDDRNTAIIDAMAFVVANRTFIETR